MWTVAVRVGSPEQLWQYLLPKPDGKFQTHLPQEGSEMEQKLERNYNRWAVWLILDGE